MKRQWKRPSGAALSLGTALGGPPARFSYFEVIGVAEGSIRLGILKDQYSERLYNPFNVAEGSIRLGILKVNQDLGIAAICRLLQRARSDWGY